MSEPTFTLLSELSEVEDYVDDPEFTEITEDGEIYVRYRITRMTHTISGHPDGWTHMANVVRVRVAALGTALLRITGRSIEEASVTTSDTQ